MTGFRWVTNTNLLGIMSEFAPSPARRRFIAGAVCFLSLPVGPRVQAEEDSGLSGAISRAKNGLSGLFWGVFDGLFRRYDQAREFLLRRKVVEAAKQAPPADVERNIADDVRDYLDLFQRFGVSLIPGAAKEPEPAPADIAPALQPNESLQGVIADIVIQTLGLDNAQDMLVFLFENYQNAPGPLRDIEAAVRAGEVRRAAGLMPALVRELLSDNSQALLIKRFGQARTNALIRGVLVALAEYAVPFLGWGTLAVSFLIALWRNRARLQNARL